MRLQPPWVYSISSKSKDVFFKLSQDKMFILPLLDFTMSSNIGTQYKKSIEGNLPNFGAGGSSAEDKHHVILNVASVAEIGGLHLLYISVSGFQFYVKQMCHSSAQTRPYWLSTGIDQHCVFVFFGHWCIGSIIIFAVVVVKWYYYPACIICV